MGSFHFVDDRDPQVAYLGNWVLGGVDKEFNGTTHGAVGGGAQAYLTFNGSSVAVYGTLSNEAGGGIVRAPFSTYSIDGFKSATFNPVATSIQYQQLFFQSPILENKQHTLVITSLIPNSTFWLDFFRVETGLASPALKTTPSTTTLVANHSQSSPARGSHLPTFSPPAEQNNTRVPAGVIAGGVIGSLAFIILMALVIWLALCRRASREPLPGVKNIDLLESQNYPKPPPQTFQGDTKSMVSVAHDHNVPWHDPYTIPNTDNSRGVMGDPYSFGLPVGHTYQRVGGLITMTATPSASKGHEIPNESFTQVIYYHNEKSMPLRVIGLRDIPPAYESPS